MKNYFFISIVVLSIFYSCSPKVTTRLNTSLKPLDFREDVTVLNIDDPEPIQSTHIGIVKVTDGGLTIKCDYETVLDKAIDETRKSGGNVLHITQHIRPDLWSTCHRIQGNMYFITEADKLNTQSEFYHNELEVPLLDTIQIDQEPSFETAQPSFEVLSSQSPQYRINVQPEYPTFRWAFQGGFSFRTASIIDGLTPNTRNHFKKILSGMHYGTDLHWFVSETIGIGARANIFTASASSSGVSLPARNYNGKIDQKVNMYYVGPSMTTRLLSSDMKNALITGLSFGYLGYRDNFTINREYLHSGGTFGMLLDIGYDIGVSENFAIGFSITLISGVLNSVTETQGSSSYKITFPNDQREGLGRIDLSVGIRFLK
ncbi:MAG: hypothetical protein ACFCUU_05745 [Cyclobacteriaceae bacterium]